MSTVRSIAWMLVAAGTAVSSAAGQSTSLTIYSSAQPGGIDAGMYRPVPGQSGMRYGTPPGYAMVRAERRMGLVQGRQTVQFDDVAAYLDPTTVSFVSLTDPAGAKVLEQNYQFDLVSQEKLLQRYLGKEIGVGVVRGTATERTAGVLMSAAPGQLVLRDAKGGVQILNSYSDISLPALPGGLLTKPTLIWDIYAEKAGEHDVRVTYQTEGITWWADYNILLTDGENANAGVLDVGAWVSILNQSGATYEEATLKLIAGTVHRAQPPAPRRMYRAEAVAMDMGGMPEGFDQKSFFEYHLYTLGRPTTIPENSTKQIELFPTARGVPCKRVLVYDALGGDLWMDPSSVMMDASYGAQSKKDVNVYLKFTNDRASGMGVPLPAGRIRVSRLDPADGAVEFIGEDVIRHTPRDEQVLIKMGNAFDVVGERTQTDFRLDTNRKTLEETVEVKVRNRKEEAVEVIVQERLYRWATWEIRNATTEAAKIDSRMVHFPLSLKPGEEGVVRYTVRYTW